MSNCSLLIVPRFYCHSATVVAVRKDGAIFTTSNYKYAFHKNTFGMWKRESRTDIPQFFDEIMSVLETFGLATANMNKQVMAIKYPGIQLPLTDGVKKNVN